MREETTVLHICLEGEAEFYIGMRMYVLRKGDMCVLFPDETAYIGNRSDDYKDYVYTCSMEVYDSFNLSSGTTIYLHIKENPCIRLSEAEMTDLIAMCESQKRYDMRENIPCRTEIARHLTMAVIYEVIGIYQKATPVEEHPYSRKDELFFRFTDLVAKHSHRERMMPFYADKLCISTRYLSMLCKEITGYTAREYLKEHITQKASSMLKTTNLSVAQIADALNFPNASFFVTFFRQHTGKTPKEYRNG